MKKVNLLILLLFFGHFGPKSLVFGQQQLVFGEEFDDNRHNWTLRDNEDAFSEVAGGKYNLEHKRSSGSMLFWTDGIVLRPDYEFEIETRIIQRTGSEEDAYGFVWGGQDAGNFYGFNINARGQFRVYKYKDFAYSELQHFTDTEDGVNSIGKANQLNIRKAGDLISFYVNGVYVFSHPVETFFGSRAGFVLYNQMKVSVEGLKVVQNSPLKVALKEEFEGNTEGWKGEALEKGSARISDGDFILKGLEKSGRTFALREIALNPSEDFSIEARIRRREGRIDSEYGLIWGAADNQNAFTFMINSFGAYQIMKRVGGRDVAIRDWTPPDHPIIHEGGGRSNKFMIRKSGASLSFYLNEVWLYTAPFQDFLGNMAGFAVSDTLQIAVEGLILRQGLPPAAGLGPKVEFWAPMEMASEVKSAPFVIKAGVSSATGLEDARLLFNGKEIGNMKNSPAQSGYNVWFERTVQLQPGENIIKVIATNQDGSQTERSRKLILEGGGAVDQNENVIPAEKPVMRVDYALFIATNEYDEWSDLTNPVNDARTIAKELEEFYGFRVEILENASRNDILVKLKEYAKMKYGPGDQLLVFFAGHGHFDPDFGEGYVVCKDSRKQDEGNDSYISHSNLRTIINSIPSRHNFLAMDVCFGGTIDPFIAAAGHRGDDPYKEMSESEFVQRKMTFKTRRYLTSGGKEYVPDGRPGQHSPFARKFLEALRNYGGHDRIITLPELLLYFERLLPEPRFGEFGTNEPGSDFLFIAK